MSRDAFVKFYANDKFVKEINFNMIKNIISNDIDCRNYSIPMRVEDAGVSYEDEFFGLIPASTHIPDEDVEYSEYGEHEGELVIKLARGAEKKYENLIADLPIETLIKEEYHKDYFTVRYDNKYEVSGSWFNIASFERMAEDLRNKYVAAMQRLFNLESIKNSEKYYMLSSEQKDDLLEDISDLKENISDYEYTMRACTSMADIMDIIHNENDFAEITAFIYIE